MLSRLLLIPAATLCTILCTFLPFLPGPYDSLAVPLSAMAQLFGKAGLLLVPVGALWIASERSNRLAGRRHLFEVLALIISSVVWVIVSLGALMFSGLSMGFGALALWLFVISRVSPRLKHRTIATPAPASVIPLYLVTVPIAVALLQMALAGPATEFSRTRAIRNSQGMIADIEQYRAARGRYPASLLSLWKDYPTGVIGIKQFEYEPSGDAYNLSFEQFTFQLDSREIVMYNPLDQQVMKSHDADLLKLTPAELELRRGYYAAEVVPQTHWKRFQFD